MFYVDCYGCLSVVYINTLLASALTVVGERLIVLGRPSSRPCIVCPLTLISYDAISVYLVHELQRNFAQILIAWVNVAETLCSKGRYTCKVNSTTLKPNNVTMSMRQRRTIWCGIEFHLFFMWCRDTAWNTNAIKENMRDVQGGWCGPR